MSANKFTLLILCIICLSAAKVFAAVIEFPKFVFEGDRVKVIAKNFDSRNNPFQITIFNRQASWNPVVKSINKNGFVFIAPEQSHSTTYLVKIIGGEITEENFIYYPLEVFDKPDPQNTNPSSPERQIETSNLITNLLTLDKGKLDTDNFGVLYWNNNPLIDNTGLFQARSGLQIGKLVLKANSDKDLTWNNKSIATSSRGLFTPILESINSKKGQLSYIGNDSTTLNTSVTKSSSIYLPSSGYLPSFIRAEYDFTVDGGDIGKINLRNGLIPSRARILRAYYEVLKSFNSRHSTSSIGISIETDDIYGLVNPIQINDKTTPWRIGTYSCKQSGNLRLISKMTKATRNLQLVINGEALTAGKLVLFVEYVILP